MIAYEGNENYIFVSYAHKDADRVIPIIESLHGAGFRIWYDSGIEVASEWPAYIQDHLMRSNLILAFISPSSVASPNCRNEINLALKYSKNMLIVYLEPTQLRDGMDLQLNSVQAVNANLHPNMQSLVGALCRAKILQCCNVEWDGSEPPEATTYVPPVANRYDTDLLELRTMTDEQESTWQSLMDLTRYLSNMPDESIFQNVQEVRLRTDKWNEGKRKFDQFLQGSSCANDALFKRTSVRFQECYERLQAYLPILEDMEQLASIDAEVLAFQKNPEFMLTSTVVKRFASVKPSLQSLLRPERHNAIQLCDKHQKRNAEMRKYIDEATDAYDRLPMNAKQKNFSVLEWAESTSGNRVKQAHDAAQQYLAAAKKAIQIYGRTPDEQQPLKNVYGRKQLFEEYNASADHWTAFCDNCTLYLEQESIRNCFRSFLKLSAADTAVETQYHNLMGQYTILSNAKAKQIPQALVTAAEKKYALYKQLKAFDAHVTDARKAFDLLPPELTRSNFSMDSWAGRVGDFHVKEAKKHADAYISATEQALQIYNTSLEGQLPLHEIPSGKAFFKLHNSSTDIVEQFRNSCSLYLGQDSLRTGFRAFLNIPLGDKTAQPKYQHLMSQYQRLSRAEASQIPAKLKEDVENRWKTQQLYLEINKQLHEALAASKRLPADAAKRTFSVSSWVEKVGPKGVKEAHKAANEYLDALKKAKTICDDAPAEQLPPLSSMPGGNLLSSQYFTEIATWTKFTENSTYCLEIVDIQERFQKLVGMGSSQPDFENTYHALMGEYNTLSPEKQAQLPEHLVSTAKKQFAVYQMMPGFRAVYASYSQIPEYLKISKAKNQWASKPLLEAFGKTPLDTFLRAVQSARDWVEECRPLFSPQAKQQTEKLFSLMSDEEQHLHDQLKEGLSNMSQLLHHLGNDQMVEQSHHLLNQISQFMKNQEPAYKQLFSLHKELTEQLLFKEVLFGSIGKELSSFVENAKSFSRIAENAHSIAQKVQPISFQTYEQMRPVFQNYEALHASVSERRKALVPRQKQYISQEVKDFLQDSEKLEKFYNDMEACRNLFGNYQFAKKYQPLHTQKHPTLGKDHNISLLEAKLKEYKANRSQIQQFDTDHAVSNCFEALPKDIPIIHRILHKGDNLRITMFVILEVLAITVACLPRVFANYGIFGWWFAAFAAATIIGTVAIAKLPNIDSKTIGWAWVPNVIYALGIVCSVAWYEAGGSLWYLAICAAVVFTFFYFIAVSDSSDGWLAFGFLLLCILALLLVVLWGGKVVTCFREANFFDPGFFRTIGNIFIGIWCILKGLVLGLLQVLMLFIGGGFWNPGFYAGFFMGAPLLNIIFYILLLFSISSFAKGN